MAGRDIKKRRAYNQEYYRKHVDRIKAIQKRWRDANPLRRRDTRKEQKEIIVSFITERDGFDCALCGKKMSISEMTIDHIISVTNGGTNHHSNIRMVHLVCNLQRSR